jgi:hypothetical protein
MAKRGGARLLHIDRQTGGWKAGEEIDTVQIPLPPGIAEATSQSEASLGSVSR